MNIRFRYAVHAGDNVFKIMNADSCAIDWEIFERKIKQEWKIYHKFRFEEAGKQ